MTARTLTRSRHPRPVVVAGVVVGHVTLEATTAGTVQEWAASDAAGRVVGYAGTRAAAESLLTNDGTRADDSTRVPDRHATGSPGAGVSHTTGLPAGVTLSRARNFFGVLIPGGFRVDVAGASCGMVYLHPSGGWEACRSFGVYVVDATATVPRDDVSGGFDRYPTRIAAVRALVGGTR